MRVLALAALLVLLSAALATAQMCGDCNGDNRVTVNELVESVQNALVTTEPTRTPVAVPECRLDVFREQTPCRFRGNYGRPECGQLIQLFVRSTGTELLIGVDAWFLLAHVTGPGTAELWGARLPNSIVITPTTGPVTVRMEGDTEIIEVDPASAPFITVGGCPFDRYIGYR